MSKQETIWLLDTLIDFFDNYNKMLDNLEERIKENDSKLEQQAA